MAFSRAILASFGLLIAAAPFLPTASAAGPEVTPREGMASWYGPRFHGRLTACGETYDQEAFTAAHRSLPFGTLLAVTNLDTGCSVMLRVNDRGPYHGNRILDCSAAGAQELGFTADGVARIRWEIIDPKSIAGPPIPHSIASGGVASPSSSSSRSRQVPAAEPPRPINSEEASW